MSAQAGAQIESLSRAIRALMSLTERPATRVANAMANLGFAFLENPPFSDVSRKYVDSIQALLAGDGTWEHKAAQLTPEQYAQLADNFSRLYSDVLHTFYKSMYRHDETSR